MSVNVSATLSMFDLEIKQRKSTLMTIFFFIARATWSRYGHIRFYGDSMAIQQLTDTEVEESKEDDEEKGQGGGVKKMT